MDLRLRACLSYWGSDGCVFDAVNVVTWCLLGNDLVTGAIGVGKGAKVKAE
jgi:formylmethanofuran dehydrogenase subunit E